MPATHALYDVDPYAITICKKGANRQRIFLKKEHKEADTLVLPAQHALLKDGDWSVFYCVVAEPGAEEDPGMGDGAGTPTIDTWRDEQEIRKAAHRFSKNKGYVNTMHGELEAQGCTVVENAVALSDIQIGEQTIKKGSWYLAIEPTAAVRAQVDAGEFTGVSMEGTGFRAELQKSEEDEKASVWRRLGEVLGITTGPLPNGSSSVPNTTDQEDEVADNEKIEALDTQVKDIAKAQGAATTAIEGLVATVNNLVNRLDKPKEEEKQPTAEELKKSLDDFADSVNTKFSELVDSVDKLADSGTTQDEKDQQDIKKNNTDPLAGLL